MVEIELNAERVVNYFYEKLRDDPTFINFIKSPKRSELIEDLKNLHQIIMDRTNPNYFNNLIEGCKLIWKELFTLAMTHIDSNTLGIEDLFEYFDEFVKFEELLYSTDEFYRDHTTHAIWTYFLSEMLTEYLHKFGEFYSPLEGALEIYEELDEMTDENVIGDLYLEIHNNRSNDLNKIDKLEKIIIEKGIRVEDVCRKYKEKDSTIDAVWIDKFKSNWKLYENVLELARFEQAVRCVAFLCHDLGYPLKRIKKISEKVYNILLFFKATQTSMFAFSFTGSVRKTLEEIINYISAVYFIKENKEIGLKKNQSIYLTALMESEDYEHGIMSAFILSQKVQSILSDFIDFKDEIKDESINISRSYNKLRILKAMALHTCSRIKIESFLKLEDYLIFIDFIEEFSRMTRASLLGTRVGQFCETELKIFDEGSEENSSLSVFQITYKFKPKETRLMGLKPKKTFIDKAKFITQHFNLKYKNFEFRLIVVDPKNSVERKYKAIYKKDQVLEILVQGFEDADAKNKKLKKEILISEIDILLNNAKDDFKKKKK